MYRLEIEGNHVDLDNSFNVSLSYKSINLLDPTSRSGGFTYSLNIIKSNNNNKIFKYIDNDNSIDMFKKSEFDCILYYGNQEIISGIFYLDEISDEYFQGQIISNTLNWTNKFKQNDILNQLTGFTTSFPYDANKLSTFTTIQDYNKNVTADIKDINFPFITRGNYNSFFYNQELNDITAKETSPRVNTISAFTYFNCLDIIPSYYYNNSIKNIFKYYNLNVECKLFSINKDYVIPFTSPQPFKWNWGRLGNAVGELVATNLPYGNSIITESYFNNFQIFTSYYSVRTNATSNVPVRGFKYTVLQEGNITINVSGRPDLTQCNLYIYKGVTTDVDYSNLAVITGGTYTSYTGDFSVGDVIYILGSDSATIGVHAILKTEIFYNNEETELNYQQILPSINPIDWLKNYMNLYSLYPYYNSNNNTVYLLTLDDYLLEDDYELKNIGKSTIKDYNTIKSLSYTFDDKDGLLTENKYNYYSTKGTDIKLLFSPTERRLFSVSYTTGGLFGINKELLPSIATTEQINLDRLTYSLADIVEYTKWSPISSYTKDDKIEYNTEYYVSILDNNSAYTPTNSNAWQKTFLGEFQTEVNYDLVTRILKVNKSSTMNINEGNYIYSDKNEKLFYLDSEFPEELDLNNVFKKYYLNYNLLFNNRTSTVELIGYLPRYKFFMYLNRPVEIKYKSDKYIILEITNYNPETEKGSFKLVKKVDYINYI